MGNVTRVHKAQTVDGKKTLIKVRFTPHVPNPADQPDVEAVFWLKSVVSFDKDKEPWVLWLLSSTLMDTREPYPLSEAEKEALIEAVTEHL